jgi:acyl-CoA synthetase (AMP-forming)/AMP-acid ligase II
MTNYNTDVLESPSEVSQFVELLQWRGMHQPDQRAFIFLTDGETDEVCLTYGDLDRQARAIAAHLQDRRLMGERALLLYPPGLEYIAGFVGCLYAGVVAVPAYPPNPARLNQTLPRLQSMIADAQATVVLTTTMIRNMAQLLFDQAPDARSLQWLATDAIPLDRADNWQMPLISSKTLAFLQYTSGSTRTPRGVVLSHGNLLHNLALISRAFAVTPDSVGALWLPPYHDMGLIGGLLQTMYSGACCVLMSPVAFVQRPLRWLQAISRYKATISGGPNFAYDLCVRKISPEQRASLDLSSWRVAFNGAEPIRWETLDRFVAAFEPCGFSRAAFLPCYGLAEATLIVSGVLRAAPPLTHTVQKAALERNQVVEAAESGAGGQTLVGCGKTLEGQQVVIVNPETLTAAPAGQIGEIWVWGPSVAQGYWNGPEETQQIFQAHLADSGAGPFLRTGDLGFVHDGELFVTGRLKDLIIIDGRNHYPQDIESTVDRCQPAIRSGHCAAFSVNVNGAEQLVIATEVERSFVTARRQQGGANVTPEAVIAAVRQAVAEQHDLRVHAVILLKTGHIPKTSSGKIRRHACREQYLNGTLDVLEE